ncbi:CheR family methyltransferase [Chitinophaga sancti]|uniref:CheR family methyltransferase n=1 Tax=Chitinophaga sancti TaxID=1004 RepID=A0A1K1SBB2_9BACT|nr:CheR family methyltransferase [Chitinophaga sancti]WQD63544.1 CheR family methyltransferase [Chitinophaga sancti]WQG90830.1 CheR family methyltransferase [Chitinophaga sancti]SFW81656.1 two-component system, chemotaxis family, CheB/CheR fusion protein [Chitinophaga sancti]
MPDMHQDAESNRRKFGAGPNAALKSILSILSEFSGVDFLQYKLSTITRRLQRRMSLMNIPGFEEYLTLIKDNENEQNVVFAELLIHVSSFFRDPGSFEYLFRTILPQVTRQAIDGEDQVRIWVAGCATGEEAYSIAICLCEIMGQESFSEKVKIFATDLSDAVIAKARKAVYPKTQMAGVSDARLERFFREVEQGYEVVSYIRDVCVFASHNMLTDPPFAKLNLISCRNVLIYMQPVLQKKMLSIFNYALKDKGFLWLGKSETNRSPDLFEMPSKKTKVYLKKNVDKWTLRSAFPTNKKIKHMTPSFDQERDENVDAQKAADSIILSMFAPSAVLLNEQFDIIEFRGVTMQFFEHGPGKASLNILKLAHRDLVHSLRSALNQAQTGKRNVKKEGITISVVSGQLTVGFEIVPIVNLHETYYLVIFNHQAPEPYVIADPKKAEPVSDSTDDKTLRVLQMEKEVQRYKDELRAVAEAYEATNEELQSANEELKSLNEELEVSQEELQVINDELSTRNNDLLERNNQLNNARLYAEAIVNTVHESLVILDANIRVVSANVSFYRFFKIDRKETEGKIFYELGNKQWNNSDLRTLLENLLSSRTPFINYELTHKFNTIGERTMLLNGQLITSQDLKEDLILLAIEDISEVREARDKIARKQEQVRINEERLRLALDGTKTGTWEFNPSTREILLSDRSRELFNISSAAPVEYDTFIKAIHPADAEVVQGSIQAALAGIDNGQINIDFRVTASEDKIKWISCKAQVFFNERIAARLLGVVTDVTEAKLYQRHLQDVNNRLNFALETGKLGSWELNTETGVLLCNDLCKANYGLPASAEVTIDKLLAAIHPEDRNRVRQALDIAIATHTLFSEEYRIKGQDTAVRWVMARGQSVIDEQTSVRHMIGITQDITERKQAQLHLQQSEAYFRMIADTAPAMIWIAEKDGSFSFFNKAWQKYTGRSLDQDKDKGWYEIMHPEDIDKWKINFSRSSRDRRNFYAEFRLKRQDGTYHWLSCSGIPRFTAQDEFVGFIGACVDIDDQKMVEDALERKVRERTIALEEANVNLSKRNHELEQFVFITSHDLQEPLRKIRLFADMLESVKPGNNKIDTGLYLSKVKQSAIRMSDLIRDLIAYSRLELGENAFLPVDLNLIVANVTEDFELLIREKQALMEISELPVLDAVPLQMNQLFYNLIGNALKFSNPSDTCRITVSANKLTVADMDDYPHLNKNTSWYRIIVADNGIGFNQSYADKLFVIFQRLNQKEKFEGTGIGLALCRKIMDIHNGDIQAFGVEHQGAAFHIIIPEVQP